MGWFTCGLFIVAIALALFKIYLKLSTGICKSNVCLVGKTAIVTGANAGIGYYSAEDFAKRGARVILACRSEIRGKDAEDKIKKATDNPNVVYKHLDLASLKSVREFAADINKTEERVDILLNNAGAAYLTREKTEDGFLPVIATNHLGHFLLTNLLLDKLKKTGNARIVNVSSTAANMHTFTNVKDLNVFPGEARFPENYLYGTSKICNVFFTIELAERLKGTNVTTYSLHPGVIETEFSRNFPGALKFFFHAICGFLLKETWEGAQTNIYCSVAKGIESQSGGHFADCKFVAPYNTVRASPDMPKKLWEESARLVGLSQQR